MELPLVDLGASRPSLLVVAAAFAFLAVLYFVYDTALPKPIPGIPYHEASSHRLFGDVPAMPAGPVRLEADSDPDEQA
ncbi:cytochrome P450 [Apiospora sp. TS-2023a]